VEVEGDFDLFNDGTLKLVMAPGHAPGQQVLIIDLPNRRSRLPRSGHGSPTRRIRQHGADALGLEHRRHVNDTHAHEATRTQRCAFVFLPRARRFFETSAGRPVLGLMFGALRRLGETDRCKLVERNSEAYAANLSLLVGAICFATAPYALYPALMSTYLRSFGHC
jgi:hypothetical protein